MSPSTTRTEAFDFPGQDGQELSGRLERPEGASRAVAIFAHCFKCSKNVLAATRLSRALAARGYTVLRFDFTGLGNSDGDFANTDFSSNVQDLVAAAAALAARERAPSLLVGHSLGGAAVLSAALELPEVRAVATIGAPSDVAHVAHLFGDQTEAIVRDGAAEVQLGGRTFTVRKEFLDDLAEQRLPDAVERLERALLVMHSPSDDTVGIDHARRLYEAARHPKSFVSLDGADHLLTRPQDAEYAAEVLAAWASRFVPDARPGADESLPPVAAGEVSVASVGRFRQRVRTADHELVADEPESLGGTDRGMAPYELLLASLGACTSMTLRMYAERKRWPLEEVRVTLTREKVSSESGVTLERPRDVFHRRIELAGALDAEQRARLLGIANRCPVHRTLAENEVRVESELV